jgi:outer membrane protein
MKKSLSIIALASSLFLTEASADIVRVEMGAGAWAQTPSGVTTYDAGGGIGGSNTFDENQDTSPYVWMLIKHPIPVIPNLRLEYTSIHATGEATGRWGDYTAPDGSASVLDMDQFDIIPYYNILDNTFWMTVDLGLDIKVLSVDYTVEENGVFPGYEDKETIAIPMAYLRTRVEVPATNLAFEADAKYVTYDGSTVYDVRAKVDYTFESFPVVEPAIEVGYRVQKIEIDDSSVDVNSDVDFSGFYAGLMLRF